MSLRWRPPGALVLAAVLPLLAIPAGAQTGIFRGAPSQRVSTSPSGLLGSPEDGSSYSGALVAAGMRAGSAGGLPSGRPGYDGRHVGGMVRKTSRLWPAPHTDGGKVQNSLSYWENWQQTPGVKETDELRPDDGMKKSRFWGQAAPPGPPVGMDRPYRRSEIPRGQSYLFKPSRNPAVTGKPVGSVLNISREQQGGSQTSAHPAPAAEDQYGASSQGSAVSSAVSGSTLVPKPAQTPKRLYGYRGFEHPTRSRAEENSGRDHPSNPTRWFRDGRGWSLSPTPAFWAVFPSAGSGPTSGAPTPGTGRSGEPGGRGGQPFIWAEQ
ncbi:unnamed protein product [Tetraodon nigroviridis]|uniref:(spotted green pufferfish) hypothetical protein n=1 Tax=Tetraodon nigroviridis TaxID=99883 RepID=Q4SF58_TETNG|nr:unnamed protein product [Tetraodon nigroviridis]